MNLWHQTEDASRRAHFENGAWWLDVTIGTWPVEAGQSVAVQCGLAPRREAAWRENRGPNSYWQARLGPFAAGDEIEYRVHGISRAGEIAAGPFKARVGSRLFLALLWHQHQPLYDQGGGKLAFPWVRLHVLRDYYSMAALLAAHPNVHLTINLTPVLLRQIEDYVEHRCTDRALELTVRPTAQLTSDEREFIATNFFDADWHNEIYPHPRYKALFDKRGHGEALDDADITDLRMWFNLAWFAPEFQRGEVMTPDGTTVSVRAFVEKGAGFTEQEIAAMIEEQFKLMRNVVAIHRELQKEGQIEVSTTPFFHPILPLLHDSDRALLDRDGTRLPPRFHFPADAGAQVAQAVAFHERCFGDKPRGMWPAEGAVGETIVTHFARHGVRWIASDAGVLRRSGTWGYETHRADVLARAWHAGDDEERVAIFFRDTELSNAIGFHYGGRDADQAAAEFIAQLRGRFAPTGEEERIVSVILDGENAWGSYQQAGRPFFDALYRRLGEDVEICTVTFSEFLEGNRARGVAAHRVSDQPRVCELAHASWIDESGSRPGNDLGTWIGEPEENAAWELLRDAREKLEAAGLSRESAAFDALYAAEGSDWFWWYGDDQNCDSEPEFDELFRGHLRRAWTLAGLTPPAELEQPIVPRVVTWAFQAQRDFIYRGDRLRFKAGCPGVLTWSTDNWRNVQSIDLRPSGGVMAGVNVHTATLPPFDASVGAVEFSFQCGCAPVCHCKPDDLCCDQRRYRVAVKERRTTP